MHVIGPVLVLAECATITSLVAATTGLSRSAATIPTMLHAKGQRCNSGVNIHSMQVVKGQYSDMTTLVKGLHTDLISGKGWFK